MTMPTERLGELPAPHCLHHAVLTRMLPMVELCKTEAMTVPVAAIVNWTEMRPDRSAFFVNSVFVAVLHLVDVAADDAADDLLVQRPAHIGLAGMTSGARARRPPKPPAHAIARARTAAAALADGAKVAKADGAFAGTTAARPGTNQTKTAHAVGFTDLVANQPPSTFSASFPAAVSRPKMEARCEPSAIFNTPRMPAFLACSSASFLAGAGPGCPWGP